MRIGSALLLAAAALGAAGSARAGEPPAPLVLERSIALPRVAGRIDHLAIDPANHSLIVAELGNDSVDVVELDSGRVVHRIAGLREPQGLAFDLAGKTIAIAEGASGAVRLFDAATFRSLATIELGTDADNVRVDPRSGHLIVGYGDGALAVIDLAARAILARIPLPAHPEGFQIEPASDRVFVNLPRAKAIGVVALERERLVETWPLPLLGGNFPLALDPAENRLAAAFRSPARIVLFDRANGSAGASQPTCGDSDDLFVDALRRRLYVACGSGSIDVFEIHGADLIAAGTIRTAPGARTALFVPALDRLFVAARAQAGERDAAILVFRPPSK